MINLKKIQEGNITDKKVLLRADMDVPIKEGKIEDVSRLEAWMPTLEYLLKNKNTVIIIGHLGRPKKQYSIDNPQASRGNEAFSLEPVAKWIGKKLEAAFLEKSEFNKFIGWKSNKNFSILENLRFYKDEEENGESFGKELADLADVYVNDSFASSHRAHASIVGVCKHVPSFAGLRLQKEVEELTNVLETPKRPMAVIIGGAKIETKLPLVEKMHSFADYVLVGGEIAENDKILLKVQHEKANGKRSVLLVADLIESLKDITPKSAENFLQILNGVSTIVWNGPMGLVEKPPFDNGTKILANGIAKLNAYKILGGGDTVSCLKNMGIINKFDFVSIGGGAMLELLAGEKLPGVEALKA